MGAVGYICPTEFINRTFINIVGINTIVFKCTNAKSANLSCCTNTNSGLAAASKGVFSSIRETTLEVV